jgi:glycosyltransferase involved in cell wall biosynthesis
VLANADGIGLLSSEEQRHFLEAGIDESRLFVIKNVVERNDGQRDKEFRTNLGLPEDVPLLLFIGRFIPAKGLLDVIRASATLRDQGMSFRLLCIGDGPAGAEAKLEVTRLNLIGHVRFFGYIPEEQTNQFYLNSDLLVFPTYHSEGFPMVIFNAAAAGLPIITTRIRAAADYLSEPENCIWVQPQDAQGIAESVMRILSRDAERSTMRSNNKLLAKRFSSDIVTLEYLKIYKQLMMLSD